MHSMTLSLRPENERQRHVDDFRPSIWENQGAMRPQWSTIALLAAYLGSYAYDGIVIMSQNERHLSKNDWCTGILDNLNGLERG